MKFDPARYTLKGLLLPAGGGEEDPVQCPSLCYLVSLVNAAHHKIADPLAAKRIISWLYDAEEQAVNAKHLKAAEEFFDRYFEGGFFPKTPCMVVDSWSPIGLMLERGMEPLVLNREPKRRAVASGIWDPKSIRCTGKVELSKTDEELFWAILSKVSHIASDQEMWLNIIAAPGWMYEKAIKSLPVWSANEVEITGRVLWKRTVLG